ncbi:hypothetical protein HYQ46_012504 [Verticillium longisporum]|nr:hypothetical protein HYQ46_012504 [Verticillium longisporum]
MHLSTVPSLCPRWRGLAREPLIGQAQTTKTKLESPVLSKDQLYLLVFAQFEFGMPLSFVLAEPRLQACS